MAGERASVLQRAQIGAESVAGTAVSANRRLGSTSIQIQPAGNINSFGPVGNKFKTTAAIGKEWSRLVYSGEASYNDLAYILSGVIKGVTPAQQGGTAAHLWDFEPASSVEDIGKTFTIEQGEVSRGGRASRVPYGLFGGLTIEWGRERVSNSGEGIGHREEDDIPLSVAATYTLTAGVSPPTAGDFTLTHGGNTTAAIDHDATPAQVQAALEALSSIGAGNVEVAATVATGTGLLDTAANVYTITFKRALAAQAVTLTGTFTSLTASGTIAIAAGTTGMAPTQIPVVPILGDQIDIFIDDAHGDIGDTKALRVFSGSFGYSNRYVPVWPVNTDEASFAAHVEVMPSAMFQFNIAADDVGQGLLATMRTGDTKYIRWRATGANIAGAYNYLAQIDMAAKIDQMIEHSDADGVYQNSIRCMIVDDEDLGYPFKFRLINALSSL